MSKTLLKRPAQGSSHPGSRFFPWLYYAKERDLGKRWFPTQIHKIRDGLAVVEATQLFTDNGYAYGGSILNTPQDVRVFLGDKAKEDALEFLPTDVIFIPTRPPLDDATSTNQQGTRKQIQRSNTALEFKVFERLRSAFKTCTREKIVVSDALRPSVTTGAEEYRELHFKRYNGGTVVTLNGTKPRSPRENNLGVGYLVSIAGVPATVFRIIACFGAGGAETLWFHVLLRVAHPHCFRKALNSPGVHVWMIPFLVPDHAPNLLTCDPSKLKPSIECSDTIEWSI